MLSCLPKQPALTASCVGARSGHRCIINERGDILVRPFPLEQRLFLDLRGELMMKHWTARHPMRLSRGGVHNEMRRVQAASSRSTSSHLTSGRWSRSVTRSFPQSASKGASIFSTKYTSAALQQTTDRYRACAAARKAAWTCSRTRTCASCWQPVACRLLNSSARLSSDMYLVRSQRTAVLGACHLRRRLHMLQKPAAC